MRVLGERWRVVLVAGLLAFALPSAAQACSVCSAADEGAVRGAFLMTTVLLSVLPLFMVGGFAWWLRRRTRELEAASLRQPTGRPRP